MSCISFSFTRSLLIMDAGCAHSPAYWFQGKREYSVLATLFNFEISELADRFLMEIEENVNPRTEELQFSKIPFENLE